MVRRLRVRLLWIGCLGLFAAGAAMALTVTTTVDRDQLRQGETLVVTYAVDESVPDPDFTPIEADFEILDLGRSRSVTLSRGQSRIENSWRLVLKPRREGKLSLPPIEFADQRSAARTIHVAPPAPGTGGVGDVRIDYEVDDRTPYVSQQVILTVSARTTGDVDELSLSRPEIVAGAGRIEALGDARQYDTVQDNQTFRVHEQRYALVPDASGMLRLSPVVAQGRIDGAAVSERSAPLELQVRRASLANSDVDEVAPDDLFLEVEVDKQSPYVQEQVLYSVRVFRAVAIENASLSMPSVSGGDAVVERVGTDRRYQASRAGRRYAVTERRFAVFPQTSGALTIDPVRLDVSVPLPSGSRSTTGFWNQPLTRSLEVAAEPVELSVKAPPADAPDPWLPARRVTLEEDWPEPDSVEVGTPITRRITLSADALMASQLPELELPLPAGVKSYPERPRRETSGGDPGLTGSLEQTLAIIPSRPGTLTVPPFELTWWNTATDQRETLRLPARTFTVAARPASYPADSSASGAGTPADRVEATQARRGWWLSLGLGAAWLATLGLWWRDKRRTAGVPGNTHDTDKGRGGADDGPSRRRAEARLRQACRAADPAAARDAALAWGRVCWPDRPPRSLGALGALTNDTVAAELATLQQALYAREADSWQGDGLYRAAVAFKPDGTRARSRESVLKPLYQ